MVQFGTFDFCRYPEFGSDAHFFCSRPKMSFWASLVQKIRINHLQ